MTPSRPGPARVVGTGPVFAPHRHGRRWYLCDRSYAGGVRQHLIRGRCGTSRPTLYAPDVRSGLVEQVLPALPPASLDLVYLDPPYGLTDGDWDRAPDWDWLGAAAARLLKPTGQVVLHGQGIMAARAAAAFERSLAYRFEIVWVKSDGPREPLHSSILHGPAPLHAHELIHVFRRPEAQVSDLTYNPGAMHRRGTPRGAFVRSGRVPQWGWKRAPGEGYDDGWRHPVDVVFSSPTRSGQLYAQKPIDLVRFLIALLTNPGDRVLDPYAGTGTTLLAAYGLGRRSMGIEASPRSWKLLMGNLAGIPRSEGGPRMGGSRPGTRS